LSLHDLRSVVNITQRQNTNWTRKCSNCECIATWRRPSHESPFPF